MLSIELGVMRRILVACKSYCHVIHRLNGSPDVYDCIGTIHAVVQRCRVIGKKVELQQLGILLQSLKDGLVDSAVTLGGDACRDRSIYSLI